MKIKVIQTIEVEKFICEMCGETLKQNGDGTFLQGRTGGDYTYTLHTACLLEFLNKFLVKNIEKIVPLIKQEIL